MKRFLSIALSIVAVAIVLVASFAWLDANAGSLRVRAAAPITIPMLQSGDEVTMTVTNLQGSLVTQALTNTNGNGHKWLNDGRTFVKIYNNSGGTVTATMITPLTVNGLAVADQNFGIDDGDTVLLGPFAANSFNDSNGYANLNWEGVGGTDVTTVTMQVFKVVAQ